MKAALVAFVAACCLTASAVASERPHPAATPYLGPASAIGSPANGCLSGGSALPLEGPGWEVMKPSRNRFWGHPALLAFLTDMARRVHPFGTFLIGDMAQPRGGRMVSGHASHQTGMDVDVMYRLAPPGEPFADSETVAQPSVLRADATLNPSLWNKAQLQLLKTFATDPRVERIFVNPVVKWSLCRQPGDHAWLAKLRPWWGHDEHFHVRLNCLAGDAACIAGKPLPEGDGCGEEVQSWITSGDWKGHPPVPAHPAPPPVPPAACQAVFAG